MTTYALVEKSTQETIGTVESNQSLSFSDVCELAGLEWKTSPEVETDGWYKDGVLYDESVAEVQS